MNQVDSEIISDISQFPVNFVGKLEIIKTEHEDDIQVKVEESLHHSMDIKNENSNLEYQPNGESDVNMNNHSNERQFSCEICGGKFITRGPLTNHLKLHAKEQQRILSESDSNYKNSSKRNFNIRIINLAGEKWFICAECGFKTKHKSSLQVHLITHTGEKSDCKGVRKEHLESHLSTPTDEKPFECVISDHKWSRKQYNLTVWKPFACEICDRKFPSKGRLTNHLKLHAKDKVSLNKSVDFKIIAHKNTSKINFNPGVKTFTDEKQFRCSVCEFKTNYKQSLKQHLIIHTGVKPLQCDICGYKTARKDHLKSHMLNLHVWTE